MKAVCILRPGADEALWPEARGVGADDPRAVRKSSRSSERGDMLIATTNDIAGYEIEEVSARSSG